MKPLMMVMLCVLLGTGPVLAGEHPLCKTIRSGILGPSFETYLYYGANSATQRMVRGGLLDTPAKTNELAHAWANATAGLERYISYDIVRVQPVSQQNVLCFVAVNHANGSLFLRLLLFEKTRGQFVVNQADLSTQPFPDAIPQG